MPARTQHEVANDERLKAALWYSVGKTVDAVTLDNDTNASPQFIAALTHALHSKIATAAADVEAFAKHAGRSTINTQDVLLLARNNDALHTVLQDKATEAKRKGAGR